MIPARWTKPVPGDTGVGPLPPGRLRKLAPRQALQALALIAASFAGGVGLARMLRSLGAPRAGGYLGWLVIATGLGFVIAVYAYRWEPKPAVRRAALGALWLVGVMLAADLIRAALR
ncbi:MAG TPA: hypothetical protein VFN38_08615 [Gemmatimonadaceae bacterium]|nr:hypothetical protein [Gemmatimonadaceae bacterium]